MAVDGGIYLLDKPQGITSNTLLNQLKRRFDIKKAGHAGTLDPMATGLMVVATQRFTRLLSEVIGSDKRYSGEFVLGYETNTLDADGETIATSPLPSSSERVIEACKGFLGEIDQIPPKVSSLKVDGVRAHKLAREGQDFVLASRRVSIYEFGVNELADGHYSFDVRCGSGTYVRALVRDLAYSVGSLGTLTRLRRSEVGAYSVSRSKKVDVVEPDDSLSVQEFFVGQKLLVVDPITATSLLQGRRVGLMDQIGLADAGRIVVFRERAEKFSDFVGFARWSAGELIPESMYPIPLV